MIITSLAFAGFTLLVLLVYYALPRRAQNFWLLGASFVFLFSWHWSFALVLACVTLANYGLARRLGATRRGRPALLWMGIAGNVLVLLHFRLADFYLPALTGLLRPAGLLPSTWALQALVPLGLSYYALQAIGYQLDVYRGRLAPARDLVDFALYLAYFPKLMAGPIERAEAFLGKLATARTVDNAVLARSATLIVIGLVRKLVFADVLVALIPPGAFNAAASYAAPQLAVFLLAYAFALYNDFAGYTSLARGVSGLFGLELSPNFQQPFFARSFTEFWNRWHISLSHWLRDYVYFPLARALARRFPDRQNWVNIAVPPLVTMLVSGLWHASWLQKTMLLWGLLHGLYLVSERVAWLNRPMQPPDQWPRWQQLAGALIVFALVALAWVPFQSDTGFRDTVDYWRGLLNWGSWAMPDWRVLVLIVPSLWLDWMQARQADEVVFLRWPLLARSALLALAILALLAAFTPAGSPAFVYQGF